LKNQNRKISAKYFLYGLISLALFISNCVLNPKDSSTSIDELLSAPEKVEIDGQHYTIETYLWRDFMPVSPPDGKPLIALIRVTEIDSQTIPETLDATKLWVINGDDLWETGFSDEQRPYTEPFQLEKVARDGPKWGPGIYVTVVVKIEYGNSTYLIKASDQLIERTD